MEQLSPHGFKKHENDSDRGVVILSSALCSGYLELLEEELVNMHHFLNQIDEQLCPDKERMAKKTIRSDN